MVQDLKHTNRLVHETSPYLLQHAHNPVDWHPWGEPALQKAKDENKPILVSIGYAACHWCHVMERESFEDEATASLMNEHFINIKIDREERPDLDHIYMDAVQAMTGSGGWPLNVFLTPDTRPFYGGTYFPPVRAYNRASWKETLLLVAQAFRDRREEIETQAEKLTEHLELANSFGQQIHPGQELFEDNPLVEMAENIMKGADLEWGGFGKAPKFPQTMVLQYLIRHSATQPGSETGRFLKQALLSLDKMIEGGIYDQIGGGFSRYSTDTEWQVPHFEKMLYDNALFISVLTEAYALTNEVRYREVISETIECIERELMHPGMGFYTALDADSEGVEGKYYIWSKKDVQELLNEEAGIFSEYFSVSEKGNLPPDQSGWKEKNILHIRLPLSDCAQKNNLEKNAAEEIIRRGRKKLLEQRMKRVPPLLDDKIILGWNALMNSAVSKAFAATGEEKYRTLSVANMEFILSNFRVDQSLDFCHTWKEGQAKFPAFLDDYAYLIEALIRLQEITSETKWLELAGSLCNHVLEKFSEPDSSFFYYTPTGQTDVILRKKEVYDGAMPSGNSVMAFNLYHLSLLLDKPEWRELSRAMVTSLGTAIRKYPTSFGNWSCLLLEMIQGTEEIIIVGEGFQEMQKEVLKQYIPCRVLMSAPEADPAFPLLAGKQRFERPAIYLCRNSTCQKPVFSAKELMLLINRAKNS